MIKLLILDFDGTIIDSNNIKQTSINNFAKIHYGYYPNQKIESSKLKGYTRYEQVSKVKGFPLSSKEKYNLDKYVNDSIVNSNLDKNLFTLLKICRLKKIKVFLVSNTPHDSLYYVVEKLRIDHLFEDVLGKVENLNKREIFQSILKNININPNEALSVGDDIFDYLIAKDCCIPFIGIRNESLNSLNGNKIFSDLFGVINYIKNK